MFGHRYGDSPPVYSPPYSATSQSFYPALSVRSPRGQYARSGVPPGSVLVPGRIQLFHRWFSPPGFVKTFQAATVLMCFVIFACVASTLVWDMSGYAYGGYGVAGADPGYYGGSYGYGSSYMTPQSAKAAMMSVTALNFLVSLGFLVGSFSRTRVTRGCRFYLSIFVCDIILAVLQVSLPTGGGSSAPAGDPLMVVPGLSCGLLKVIMDIVFVIGVNPMSQSSQSALYNPMLMMCQNVQSNPSLSSSLGGGFPAGFPMYNRYLYHYCFMDPEEVRPSFHPRAQTFCFQRFSPPLRRWRSRWASWWWWPCCCRPTSPTRPAARSGDTVKPTSAGTSLWGGRQRAGVHQPG